MERKISPILSLGILFFNLAAHAVPAGVPQDYNLRTSYSCQANGISVHNKEKVISSGETLNEVKFTAIPGGNQSLSFGEKDYIIWPRAVTGTFTKSLNLLVRDSAQKYRIMQEIDLGDSQKTKTNISMTVRDRQGDERPVSCRVEVEWLKKAK
jgi:hypothetical protein